MADIRFSIDYLTVTYKHPMLDGLPGYYFNLRWEPCAPRNGYGEGLYSPVIGAWIFTGGGERMKGTSHAILPSKAINTLGSMLNYSSTEVMRNLLLNWSPKVTRCDIAFDFRPAYFTPYEVAKWYDKGTVETPARTVTLIKSLNGKGDTLYVGSRTSDKYLRIYDKGLEQGTDELWTRVELELKGQVAKKVQERLTQSSEREFLKWCGGILKGMITIPEARYTKWLESVEVVTGLTTRPEANIERWLREQVAPALRRELGYETGHDLLRMLLEEAKCDPELLISIAHDMIPIESA